MDSMNYILLMTMKTFIAPTEKLGKRHKSGLRYKLTQNFDRLSKQYISVYIINISIQYSDANANIKYLHDKVYVNIEYGVYLL